MPVAPMPTETRSERGTLGLGLEAVGSFEAVDQMLSPAPLPTQYRVLRAEQVQCLAAASAPLARLYASESETVLAASNRHTQCAVSALSRLMAIRALDERNKAAGMALELFYGLAEAEAATDILDRSLVELDRAAANLDDLKRSGLKVPVDRTALARQKLDWLDRRIQVLASARQMRGQLQQLCGFELDETTPPWPEADLTVTVAPIDVASAVAQGLANRADVAALRMLGCSLSSDTLPAARAGVQTMAPGLGASVASRRLLGGDAGGEAEAQSRRSQVAQARDEAERNASREITEAAATVETRLREIAVAKERWDVWLKRATDLDTKRVTDGATAFDLSAARLEVLRAEGETLHRVIAWKIAQVKLRKAQGLLAAECGYRVCAEAR
jgi:hypothetical protein